MKPPLWWVMANSTYGKFARNAHWSIQPITRAEQTVYWFMWGEKWGYPPKHPNCRCVIKGV